MTRNRHSRTIKKLRAVLIVLAGALLLTAAAIFIVQWNEGEQAARSAQALLNQSGIKAPPPSDTEPAAAQPLPAATRSPEFQGYSVIVRLDIETIDLHLPILSETSDKALKVSVCRFEGPEPGGDGDIVITGHDYRSGAIFGRLSELKIGDTALLTGTDGKTYSYAVYKIDHIKPDEAEKLDETTYTSELSLLTCENNGNGRLLLRCRLEE